MVFDTILNKIKEAKSIAIFTHIKADGDCLGAGFALYHFCKNLNKEVSVFNGDKIHSNYRFITADKVKSQLDKDYDLFIAVDSAVLKKLGCFEVAFSKHKNTINIDHHIANTSYANINFINPNACSACEVLYDFFTETKQQLDDKIAQALLCGLSSDTGCFRHSNTTHRAHFIASELLKYNVNLEEMNYYLFRIKTKAEINLIIKIYQNLKYFSNGRVVISGFDKRDLDEVGASFEDDPHLSEELSGIEGVQIAITYRQDVDNGYYVSFRSSGDIDVNLLAKTFGGGGHKHASGCKLYDTKSNIIKKLAKEAGKFVR